MDQLLFLVQISRLKGKVLRVYNWYLLFEISSSLTIGFCLGDAKPKKKEKAKEKTKEKGKEKAKAVATEVTTTKTKTTHEVVYNADDQKDEEVLAPAPQVVESAI